MQRKDHFSGQDGQAEYLPLIHLRDVERVKNAVRRVRRAPDIRKGGIIDQRDGESRIQRKISVPCSMDGSNR